MLEVEEVDKAVTPQHLVGQVGGTGLVRILENQNVVFIHICRILQLFKWSRFKFSYAEMYNIMAFRDALPDQIVCFF